MIATKIETVCDLTIRNITELTLRFGQRTSGGIIQSQTEMLQNSLEIHLNKVNKLNVNKINTNKLNVNKLKGQSTKFK